MARLIKYLPISAPKILSHMGLVLRNIQGVHKVFRQFYKFIKKFKKMLSKLFFLPVNQFLLKFFIISLFFFISKMN